MKKPLIFLLCIPASFPSCQAQKTAKDIAREREREKKKKHRQAFLVRIADSRIKSRT